MEALLAGLLPVPSTVLELTTSPATCAKQVTAAERPAAAPTITSFGVSHVNGHLLRADLRRSDQSFSL